MAKKKKAAAAGKKTRSAQRWEDDPRSMYARGYLDGLYKALEAFSKAEKTRGVRKTKA